LRGEVGELDGMIAATVGDGPARLRYAVPWEVLGVYSPGPDYLLGRMSVSVASLSG
jgi:hypothetical protein